MRYGIWVTDLSILGDVTVLTLAESIDANNLQCSDLAESAVMLNYLRHFLGNESIQACADVLPYCESITRMPDFGGDGGKGWASRMLCSQTCGCQTPGSEHISVQGCPYGTGRACQATQIYQDFISSSSCSEKTAQSLRQYSPWVKWINSIRAYGESSANLALKDEALVIAESMWDNGCGFAANLSARNISWGSCFSWNSSFEWQFKTIEVFCPLTCGCSRDTVDSACPRPFGYTCDQLNREGCLTLNEQTYCRGFSPSVQGRMVGCG